MQFYEGPSRRVLKRTKSASEIKVDGTRDHEEERAIFVKQTIRLQQKPTGGAVGPLAAHWVFVEEQAHEFFGA